MYQNNNNTSGWSFIFLFIAATVYVQLQTTVLHVSLAIIGVFPSCVPPFPSGGWIWSVDMKYAYEMRAVKKSGGLQKVSLIKASHIRGPVRWGRVETQLPTQACQSQQARGPYWWPKKRKRSTESTNISDGGFHRNVGLGGKSLSGK